MPFSSKADFEVEVTLDEFNKAEERLTASKAAQRRWRLLKNVSRAIRRTSLTKEESDLLKAIGNKNETRRASRGSSVSSQENTPSTSDESSARARLRQSITSYSNSLTSTEKSFLGDLLEAEEVSDEALENTNRVLETDAIYKEGSSDVLPTVMRRRRTSRRSCRASVTSSLLGKILEIEPTETLAQDVTYRKELWKKRQSSLSIDKSGSDNDNKSDISVEDENNSVMADSCKPPTDSLMSLFSKFIGEASDYTISTTASSHSDEEEENKGGDHEKELVLSPVEFSFLGTCPTHEAEIAQLVLTPPLMDTLRSHMPYAIQEDNVWLKYSLAKDGASIGTLLSRVRTSTHTILAIETTDREVFGSFTSSPWRHMGPTYYGSCESFLWRMAGSRSKPCDTLLDRAKLESDIEVFKWTGENRNIQMSTPKMIAVGGGEPDKVIEERLLSGSDGGSITVPPEEKKGKEVDGYEFGLALNSDMSSGSSGKCVTFGTSSGLSRNGSTFEVLNVEVWTMTPMTEMEQAEKLELGRHFVFSSITAKSNSQPKHNSKLAMAA